MVCLNKSKIQVKLREKIKRGIALSLVFSITLFSCDFSILAQDIPVNPYSHRHNSREMPVWEQLDEYGNLLYALNTQLPRTISAVPSAVTDKYGNKVVLINGKRVCEVETDGDVIYFRKGQKNHKKTSSGWLTRKYCWDNEGNATVKNEWDEVVGNEEHGLGGKLLARFDSHWNPTHLNEYDSDSPGHWEYNTVTKTWKRYDLVNAVEERKDSKEGTLAACWQEQDGHLWRIAKIKGEVDGDRLKYSEDGLHPLELYGQEGNLKAVYHWEDGRLKEVISYIDGTYEIHGEFGIIEQGVISPDDGDRVATWEHEWKGSRHVSSYEIALDTSSGEPVQSGKRVDYTPEDNIEDVQLVVNETNQEWLGELYSGQDGSSLPLGEEILLEDYVYLYEIKDSPEILGNAGGVAEHIDEMVSEYEEKDKADAGLLFKVTNSLIRNPADEEEDLHPVAIAVFDEYNSEEITLSVPGSTGGGFGDLASEAEDSGFLDPTPKPTLEDSSGSVPEPAEDEPISEILTEGPSIISPLPTIQQIIEDAGLLSANTQIASPEPATLPAINTPIPLLEPATFPIKGLDKPFGVDGFDNFNLDGSNANGFNIDDFKVDGFGSSGTLPVIDTTTWTAQNITLLVADPPSLPKVELPSLPKVEPPVWMNSAPVIDTTTWTNPAPALPTLTPAPLPQALAPAPVIDTTTWTAQNITLLAADPPSLPKVELPTLPKVELPSLPKVEPPVWMNSAPALPTLTPAPLPQISALNTSFSTSVASSQKNEYNSSFTSSFNSNSFNF